MAEEFRNVWYFYHNTMSVTIQKQSEKKPKCKTKLDFENKKILTVYFADSLPKKKVVANSKVIK